MLMETLTDVLQLAAALVAFATSLMVLLSTLGDSRRKRKRRK